MAKALLQLQDLHKSYGPRAILDGASASFSTDQKIGVIGRNGSGKSTLCKIITGHEEADSGRISKSANLKLSYLEQQDPFRLDETVLSFLVRYTHKEEWQCGEMAHRFHISNEMLSWTLSTLPGGYRTRAKLAAMLLAEPNFLILDEPTNYLDLSTLILLENFLQDFRGGYLIVSHDREFLKRTCEHTLEVEAGQLTLYPGNIEDYFTFKEEGLKQKKAHNITVEKKREQLQEFVDRFRAKASTASRAKSKLKQIGRLKTIEIQHPMSNVRIRIPAVERRSGTALSCDELSIGYPEKEVARKIDMMVDRTAHVAVLGDNGQGKTTFLRTIAGDLPAQGGTFRWSAGLNIGYYAQHVFGTLNPEDDVLAFLQRNAAAGVTTQDVLQIAGSFLFKENDVRKKIAVLSGGERARLVLAGLLLTQCQALLLDEPTNHLDFETVEALGRALKEFAGTLFFISHDRTFVNLVATEIIEVKNGRVLKYPGTYEDYTYHLEQEAQGIQQEENRLHKEYLRTHPVKPAVSLPEENRGEASEKKTEVVKLKGKIAKSESLLKHLAKEKTSLLEERQHNPFHHSKQRNERLKELTILVEKEEAHRRTLQAALESLT
jgi:ATP-binding cassette subfamily F protein 3